MKSLVTITLLLTGLVGMSQHGPHGRGHADLTPEQMATIKTKKMTLSLDLNEKQQNEVQEIHLEQAELRLTKKEERKAREEKPTSDERYAAINEKLDRQIEIKAQMKEILNKDQFAKWEELQTTREMKGRCRIHNKRRSARG